MSDYIPKFQAIQLLISSSIDLQFLKSFTIVLFLSEIYYLGLGTRTFYYLSIPSKNYSHY